MADTSAFGERAQDVGQEDGEMRSPLAGLFSNYSATELPSFEVAVSNLIADHPNLKKLAKMAMKKARKVKEYPGMSQDKKSSVVFYSRTTTLQAFRRTPSLTKRCARRTAGL